MDLLFKIEGTPDKERIKETNFKKHYPGVNTNMSWPSLKPHIEHATTLYIIPYIGQTLYDDIATKYNDGTILDSDQTRFLEKLQNAIAYFSIYIALPTMNAIISDTGIKETSSSDHTSTAVAQWRFKILRKETGFTADLLLDDLLKWLETTQAINYFNPWRTYVDTTGNTSDFFRTTEQLNNHMRINNSRRTYIAMLPFLKKAQFRYLVPILCQEQIDDLKDNIKDDTLSAVEIKLVDICRRLLAEYALEMGIPHLTIELGPNGFHTSTYSDGMDSKKSLSAQSELNALSELRHQAKEDGQTASADLIKFLYKNADSFSIWKASDCYYEDIDQNKKIITPSDGVGGIMT